MRGFFYASSRIVGARRLLAMACAGNSLLEHLGAIYTLQEAAERLRMTPRKICKIARAYGLCARVGREYLFSEDDIEGIWNTQREATRAKLGLSRHPTADIDTDKAYEELLKYAKSKKRRPPK